MQGNDHSQDKHIVDQKIAELTNVLEQKKRAANTLAKTLKEFEVSLSRFVIRSTSSTQRTAEMNPSFLSLTGLHSPFEEKDGQVAS